jgi:hypothetical protein
MEAFCGETKLRNDFKASLHPQKNMEAFCGETKPRVDFEASPHPQKKHGGFLW